MVNLKKPFRGEAWFRDLVKDRLLKKNQNIIVMFVGDTGSGKSYAQLRGGEIIYYPPLTVMSAEDFMDKAPGMEKGQVINWDDVGATGANARAWQSVANRVISEFLESFRFLNTALFISAPMGVMADITFRRLAHLVIWMKKIDYKRNLSLGYVYEWWKNPLDGSYGPRHPVVWTPQGPIKLRAIRFRLPSNKSIEEYETMKKKMMDERWKDLRKRLAVMQ